MGGGGGGGGVVLPMHIKEKNKNFCFMCIILENSVRIGTLRATRMRSMGSIANPNA